MSIRGTEPHESQDDDGGTSAVLTVGSRQYVRTSPIELGHGAFSITYAARHLKADDGPNRLRGPVVAVKLYRDPAHARSTVSETVVMQRMRHQWGENLVPTLHVGCEGVVMSMVGSGMTMATLRATLIDRDAQVTSDMSRRAARHMVRGLSALHSEGIIHRDIKLENVLFDGATGTFRLADFNLAVAVPRRGSIDNWSECTVHDDGDILRVIELLMCGTSYYTSPEAAATTLCVERRASAAMLGKKNVLPAPHVVGAAVSVGRTASSGTDGMFRLGRASDVWSLGLTLAWFVFGRRWASFNVPGVEGPVSNTYADNVNLLDSISNLSNATVHASASDGFDVAPDVWKILELALVGAWETRCTVDDLLDDIRTVVRTKKRRIRSTPKPRRKSFVRIPYAPPTMPPHASFVAAKKVRVGACRGTNEDGIKNTRASRKRHALVDVA